MSYKKVGGIHFLRIMRFGFNFYWTRKPVTIASLCKASDYETRRYARSVLMSDGTRRLIPC